MPFTNPDRTIAELTQRESIPGLAFALVQGNEIIEAHGYGITAGEDGGLPVTLHTLFRIGSTTKPLVGTAMMRLVEGGQLELDKPIKEYLDSIPFE